MLDPQMPGAWQDPAVATFIAATGTQAKILCDVAPAAVAAAISGEAALPGESTVRQRVRTGGQRIIDGSISSTDGSPKSVLIYLANLFSIQPNMGVATITGTNTINRTVGSFITDGVKPGDAVMGFGHTTAGNDGVLGIATTVTASAIAVNGTPFTNETMPAGYRLFRVSQKTRKAVPANSGNTDALPPVPLLGGAQDPGALPPPDTGLSLGPNGAMIVGMVAAVSALPAQVSVHALSAMY